MKVYLASLATNNYELENRVYKNFNHSIEYIYENLKSLSIESIKDSDFFDRDYIQKYFTKEYFDNFKNVVCKSVYGEFFIKKIKSNKYQFVFSPVNQDYFFVCELEILELLY
jgi:hypothetical protein